VIGARWRGESFKQIAYSLGISVGTATTLASRAKRRIALASYAKSPPKRA
jgi:DNA-directed RNA polymerase specialized sigma24 family protein